MSKSYRFIVAAALFAFVALWPDAKPWHQYLDAANWAAALYCGLFGLRSAIFEAALRHSESE